MIFSASWSRRRKSASRVHDVHGLRQSYAFAEPAIGGPNLAAAFDRCGGGEWDYARDLGGGWFELLSRLD